MDSEQSQPDDLAQRGTIIDETVSKTSSSISDSVGAYEIKCVIGV